MREALEFVLVICLAVLVLGIVKLLNEANKRLLAGGSIFGGRIQPRGSNRFPLIPTKDSEVERKRPAVWQWTLVDLLVIVVVLMWLLATHR
ncbi:MAG TPA: hypothetical protein VK788_02330 [Terriglobales bacterium]|jgi:hypothetical protein|nr:hypothetical protein [Terriglobales bacterium]